MTRTEVEEEVRRIVVDQLGISSVEVKLSHNLTADLAADWLDLIELAMSTEEFFGVCISDDDIGEIKTVLDICDIVCKKLQIS